jgi:hypothetical protein
VCWQRGWQGIDHRSISTGADRARSASRACRRAGPRDSQTTPRKDLTSTGRRSLRAHGALDSRMAKSCCRQSPSLSRCVWPQELTLSCTHGSLLVAFVAGIVKVTLWCLCTNTSTGVFNRGGTTRGHVDLFPLEGRRELQPAQRWAVMMTLSRCVYNEPRLPAHTGSFICGRNHVAS